MYISYIYKEYMGEVLITQHNKSNPGKTSLTHTHKSYVENLGCSRRTPFSSLVMNFSSNSTPE